MKKFVLTTTIIVVSAATTVALANPAGRGGKGKDWDSASFNIRKDSTVEINGTCYAVAAGGGNQTRAQLWVNGSTVRDTQFVDSEYASVSYQVSGNGKYDVLMQCDNRRANATSASIKHQKIDDSGY